MLSFSIANSGRTIQIYFDDLGISKLVGRGHCGPEKD